MKPSIPTLRQLIHRLQREGWQVDKGRGNHIKLIAPNGRIVVASSSPGDRNAIHNVLRDVRKATTNAEHV